MTRYFAEIDKSNIIPFLEFEVSHRGFAFYYVYIRVGGRKIEQIANGTTRMAGIRSLKLLPEELFGTTLTIETRALDFGPGIDEFSLSIKLQQNSNSVPLFVIFPIGEERVPNDEINETIGDQVAATIDIDFPKNG